MFHDIHAVGPLILDRRGDHLRAGFEDSHFATLHVLMHGVGKPAPCITAHARRPHIQARAVANWNQPLKLELFANRNQRMPKAPPPPDDLVTTKINLNPAVERM